MLEKTLESPPDSKARAVSPKGGQPSTCTGRTDAEASVLWPPDVKRQLNGKDSDAGKTEGRKRGGTQRMRWLTDSKDMNLSKLGNIYFVFDCIGLSCGTWGLRCIMWDLSLQFTNSAFGA